MFLRQQAVAVEPAVEQAIENVPHSAISVAVLAVAAETAAAATPVF